LFFPHSVQHQRLTFRQEFRPCLRKEHCGCDTKQGVETYVQNLISDSQQRGLNCGMSMHVPACITAYCSSCAGHSGIMESCMKTGMEYFSSSCGQQQGQLTAAYMPAPGALF
jgi:hypothetical protein